MKKYLNLCLLTFSIFTYSQSRKEIGSNFIQALFIEGNAEKTHHFFDESVAQQSPIDILKSLPGQLEGQFGKFKNVIEVNNEQDTYYYYSEFEKSKPDIQITFTDHNKIIGFYVLPHKDFIKEDDKTTLKIKSDGLELKGTLLQPTEDNKKKLVIFVHGSGANDRNETVGENSPFKDIAEYLLKNGISSYRYDKRNYSYPASFDDQSTVEQETINDAVNISTYFKKNNDFKGYQIIILGHSLGAYLMPKIASKAEVSKYIFLSGNARPLQDLLLDQFEYLHKIDASAVSDENIQNLKKGISVLNSSTFNANTPKEELPMGIPAAYWKYLQNYHPLEEVKHIKVPMFFAQGDRDYQVTEKDFMLWKTALKNNTSAEFKLYPGLSHLYIKGSGIASPKDYTVKGKVDEVFLTDLKNFILK
ncbi:alpha/beta fold hydrolase [Chryseobacterium sp. Marseille-Q8038]